uniref:Uncharacterized protein n=1 Tax=Zea mays TaxID=4577 RepID=C0P2F4_MAIZE|nr:unknown [Zea mays]
MLCANFLMHHRFSDISNSTSIHRALLAFNLIIHSWCRLRISTGDGRFAPAGRQSSCPTVLFTNVLLRRRFSIKIGTWFAFALIRATLSAVGSTTTAVRRRSTECRTLSTHFPSGGPVISAHGQVRSYIGAGHVLLLGRRLLAGRLAQI